MNVDVVSETVCKGQYESENMEILDTMMCASAPGKDACQVYYLIMYLCALETAGHTKNIAFQDIPRNNEIEQETSIGLTCPILNLSEQMLVLNSCL